MDKQFARILMLSVLLPAGAALGEAIQHEHLSFSLLDQKVISRLEGAPPARVERQIAAREDDAVARTVADHRDKFKPETVGQSDSSHEGMNR